METVRAVEAVRRIVGSWRGGGQRVGLVPTMGGIHDGHLALVRAARAGADRVVASLFVNPTQFAPGEDLGAYPRDEAADAAKLAGAGVDLLFAPPVEAVYAPGFATEVVVSGLTEGLCGPFRPGHFAGVATVVAKLLNMVGPDAAWFGEKDYQQLLVVRRMVRDLDLPVVIHGVATVREPDGLALSSRNAYLTAAQRSAAPALHQALEALARRVAGGSDEVAAALPDARRALEAAGFGPIDYVAVCDAATLEPIAGRVDRPARTFGAAWLGRARLIDNVPI